MTATKINPTAALKAAPSMVPDVADGKTTSTVCNEVSYQQAVCKDGLKFAVQYREKLLCGKWSVMAAFDKKGPAESYLKGCAEGNPPWEYRIATLETASAVRERALEEAANCAAKYQEDRKRDGEPIYRAIRALKVKP